MPTQIRVDESVPAPAPALLDRDQACARIGNKLSSVSVQDCLSSGLVPSGHYSVNGVPILVKEYPPLPGVKPQARVLLLGGIHGDEFSAVSIVFKWMKVLDAHHSGLFHWRLTPLANPDGLLQKKAQRMNARGIDLNRNFPTQDWVKDSLAYWENRTGRDPRRYPGTAAASEPETRWVLEEIARFKPDVIISLHAPYGLLDFDGPSKIPPKQVGHLYLEQLGSFPGSLGRYGWATENIPVVTIELPYSGIMPTPKEQMSIWVDMVSWLKRHAGKVDDEGVSAAAAPASPPPP